MIEHHVESGKYSVTAMATKLGRDLVILIYGGEKPHIGAVAVSVPRPSRRNPLKISSTTSVFTLMGHKEDLIARNAAAKLARTTNSVTVVLMGIHVNKATKSDIKLLVKNAEKAVNGLIQKILGEK